MTLPHDVSRCSGLLDLRPGGDWCPMRHECKRHLAWLRWDMAAGVKGYRGIVVNIGVRDCKDKIEADDDDE